MNYSVVVTGGVILFSILWYFVRGSVRNFARSKRRISATIFSIAVYDVCTSPQAGRSIEGQRWMRRLRGG
jgi:hypothetical protein